MTYATLEELTIVGDDSVWHPGDRVTMTSGQCYERSDCYHHPGAGGQGDEAALIDLSDEACLPPSAQRSSSSATTTHTPLDPFELGDLQLMTTHNISVLDVEQIDLELEEVAESDVGQIESQLELVGSEVDLIEFPCEQVGQDSSPPPQPPSSPASGMETETAEQRQQKLLDQLAAIFPRDIVETVLAMNASNNLDFLAEQCLLLQLNQ